MNNDPLLQIDPNACPRCGLNIAYHTSGTIKCPARKKPYKLRDGEEVHLGMTVWWYRHYSNTIVKGFVGAIFGSGNIGLRKFPEDRPIPDEHGIVSVSWEPSACAYYSCFSSLENAEAYKAKEEKRRARCTIAYSKKNGLKI